MREVLRRALPDAPEGTPSPASGAKPRVVFVVGVNGGGKTTSVGKLAARSRAEGRSVTVVAAEDAARAGIELSVAAANERATALYRAHDLEPAIEWSHWVLALDR